MNVKYQLDYEGTIFQKICLLIFIVFIVTKSFEIAVERGYLWPLGLYEKEIKML